jgi:hypothetical protein
VIKITLTEKSPEWSPENNLLTIAPTPERISFRRAGRWAAYDLLSPGPIELKSGEGLSGVSWSGIWGDTFTRDALSIPDTEWLKPMAAINKLDKWRFNATPIVFNIYGAGGTSESGTDIHPFTGMKMVVKDLTWDHVGGYGDIEYTLEMQEHKEIGVSVKSQEKTNLASMPEGKIIIKSADIEKITPAMLSKKYKEQYALSDQFVALMSPEQKVFLANNGYLAPGSYNVPQVWKNGR